MIVGKIEYAPDYGSWLDKASPTGRRQRPFEVDPRSLQPANAPAPLDWPNLTPANDNHVQAATWPKVVAFTGLAGAGKSTAADILTRRGYQRVKFAGPLKAMMRAIGFTDDHIEGALKEIPHPWLQGKTPRHAMQTLGTEWGRECIGRDFWTGLWWSAARDIVEHGGLVVTDDCRFPNEAAVVRSLGGVVIQVAGRGGIAGSHSSEAQAFDADAVVVNTGTLADLESKVLTAMEMAG